MHRAALAVGLPAASPKQLRAKGEPVPQTRREFLMLLLDCESRTRALTTNPARVRPSRLARTRVFGLRARTREPDIVEVKTPD